MQDLRTEEKVIYPIKTLSQLPPILKGFRKEKGLTQANMAEKLGITQQSYAYFEANPTTATLERLFTVLRMLDVEMSLDQLAATTSKSSQMPKAMATGSAKPAVATKVSRTVVPKRENW
jgi:HTH-type transcriptional regulator / antitoxin HipB